MRNAIPLTKLRTCEWLKRATSKTPQDDDSKISNIPSVQQSEYPLTKPSFPPRSQRSRGTAESNESRTRESHFAATFTDLTYISLMLRGHITLSDELVTHFSDLRPLQPISLKSKQNSHGNFPKLRVRTGAEGGGRVDLHVKIN
jgi:hypothetical protein